MWNEILGELWFFGLGFYFLVRFFIPLLVIPPFYISVFFRPASFARSLRGICILLGALVVAGLYLRYCL